MRVDSFSATVLVMPLNAFNPKGRAFAAKQFVFAGETIKVGDEFDHKTRKLHEHDLRGLWLADLIDFKSTEDVAEEQAARELVEKERARIAALEKEDDELAELMAEEAAAKSRAELGIAQPVAETLATPPVVAPTTQAVTATETPKAKAKAKLPAPGA